MTFNFIVNFFLFVNGKRDIFLEYLSFREVVVLFKFLKNIKKIKKIYWKIIKFDDKEYIFLMSYNYFKLLELFNFFSLYLSGKFNNILSIGKILGYPECCINSFYDFFKDISPYDYKYYYKDYVELIFKRSKFIYKELNFISNYKFFSYVPCSFDCEFTINYVLNNILFLKKFSFFRKGFNIIKKFGYMQYYGTNKYFIYDRYGKLLEKNVYYEYNNKRELGSDYFMIKFNKII